MANYYVLLTDYGKSFIANAQAGSQLALTDVVLGDANDQPYLPDSRLTQTSLVNQRAKVAVTSIKVVNDTTAEVSAVVPSNVGGFNLHEVGITDSSGKLIYVGNFHGGYRPTLTEGAGGDMELIFTITADNLATVVIEMDGNVVIATRDWVTGHFVTKPKFQGHLDDKDAHPQYVLSSVFNETIVALNQRIDELLLQAGVGAVLGRLDMSFSGSTNSYSAFATINNVRYTVAENGNFNFILSERFNNGSIGEVNCRAGDSSLLVNLYYPEGFDSTKHEIRSSRSYFEREDGTGIYFALPYTSDREVDSNFYMYFIATSFYFEIVKK